MLLLRRRFSSRFSDGSSLIALFGFLSNRLGFERGEDQLNVHLLHSGFQGEMFKDNRSSGQRREYSQGWFPFFWQHWRVRSPESLSLLCFRAWMNSSACSETPWAWSRSTRTSPLTRSTARRAPRRSPNWTRLKSSSSKTIARPSFSHVEKVDHSHEISVRMNKDVYNTLEATKANVYDKLDRQSKRFIDRLILERRLDGEKKKKQGRNHTSTWN